MADQADLAAPNDQGGQGAPQADNGAQPQADNGQQSQHSESFNNQMQSIQAAIGGLDGNSFDTGETDSSFNFDQGLQQVPNNQESNSNSNNGVSNQGDEPSANAGVESSNQAGEQSDSGSQEQNHVEGEGQSSGIDSQLFDNIEVDSGDNGAQENLGFESIDDLEKFLETGNYGITKDDLSTEIPKLFEDRKALAEESKKRENLEAVFEKMPSEIYQSIVAWDKGEDWREIIKNSDPTDYSKEWASQDVKSMVENFFPGKISEEEWAEYKDEHGDDTTKSKVGQYLQLAEERYGMAQQKFNAQVKDHEAKAQQYLESSQAAFEASRAEIFEAFKGTPLSNINETALKDIDGSLSSQRQVLLEFFNEDGTLRSDAHTKMAMAKHGKNLSIQQAQAMQKRAITEARREIIAGTAEESAIKKSGDKNTPNEMEQAKAKARQQAESILGTPDQNLF